MMRPLVIAFALLGAAASAQAASYPVSGRWGESTSSAKGAIDCKGKRVITFNGETRTDSKGGVPAYRNKSISGSSGRWQVVDVFTTGQISNGSVNYTLMQTDADHIALDLQKGGTIRLQRCK